jgi:Putative transposase
MAHCQVVHSRLIALNETGVTFSWKNYRIEGRDRYKTMTLATTEFIRRFLIHVLPHGFHRIRHYGLFAKTSGADNIARARELLAVSPLRSDATNGDTVKPPDTHAHPCPAVAGAWTSSRPSRAVAHHALIRPRRHAIRIDTS